MSVTSQAELAKKASEKTKVPQVPQISKREAGGAPASVVQTADQFHQQAVEATIDNLVKVGHPRTPEQVAAHGEANTILAKIENAGIGAEAVGLSGDVVTKGVENLRISVEGAKPDYAVKGLVGHRITMGKIAKRVVSTGIAEKIHHLLSRNKGNK